MARTSDLTTDCVFLTYSLLFLLHSPCYGQPQWNEPTGIVAKQGDNITITCTVNLGNDPFGVVRIARLETTEDGETKQTAILDNNSLKAPFDLTGRYLINYDFSSVTGNARVDLTFQGIRGEDGGTFSCFPINDDSIKENMIVTVQVPVHEVYLIKLHKGAEEHVADGVTIHLQEGEAGGVGCVVTREGSRDEPFIRLTVNGDDATNDFSVASSVQIIKPVPGGPLTYVTEVKYTYLNIRPSPEFNQKNLTCQAQAEGYDAVFSSAFLDVKYKPVLTCSKYEHYATIGTSITLRCRLRANPGAKIVWSFGSTEEDATPVNLKSPSNFASEEQAWDEDHTQVSLTIQTVDATNFTNYYLVAENDLGSSSVTVTLHQGAENTASPAHNPDTKTDLIPWAYDRRCGCHLSNPNTVTGVGPRHGLNFEVNTSRSTMCTAVREYIEQMHQSCWNSQIFALHMTPVRSVFL